LGMAADGDFLHLHRIGEIALGATGTSREMHQYQPLRPRQPLLTDATIKFFAREPADIA
jgi:hypothetical protein